MWAQMSRTSESRSTTAPAQSACCWAANRTSTGVHRLAQPVATEGIERSKEVLARQATERGSDVSRRRGNRSDFLLSGVIRCGRCGRAYIGMSAHGKGGIYHYYACTARQKYGPKACSAERLSRQKLEDAVLRQLTGMYRDGSLIRDALGIAREQAREGQPSLDERRRSIEAEIARTEQSSERYFEAFEQGRLSPERCEQRLARLQARLDELREQRDELASEASDAVLEPTAADLRQVADRLDRVIASGEPGKTKALLRLLIAELRVNNKAEIQPTYRVLTPDRLPTAGVCATSGKVGRAGIEPATLGLRGPCSAG